MSKWSPKYWLVEEENMGALTVSWPQDLLNAIPSIALIGKVLQRVKTERKKVILISPFWPWWGWFPTQLEVCLSRLKPSVTRNHINPGSFPCRSGMLSASCLVIEWVSLLSKGYLGHMVLVMLASSRESISRVYEVTWWAFHGKSTRKGR